MDLKSFLQISLILVYVGNLCSARFLAAMKCKLPRCPPPPHGCRAYIDTDENGCPSGCRYSCGAPWCGARSCAEPCYGGYKKNQMGCSTCDCKPLCTTRLCPDDCPYGYKKDEYGCSTCMCKPQPLPCHHLLTCDTGVCPNKCACQPNCYIGPVPDMSAQSLASLTVSK